MSGATLRQSFSQLLISALVMVLLGGCLPPPEPTFVGALADAGQDSTNSARLGCFMVLRSSDGPAVRLEVKDVEILINDLWLPLGSGPVSLDAARIGAGQLFLGSRALPPGSYRHLRLTVTQGAVRQADGSYAVVTREPYLVDLPLPSDLTLAEGDSRVLLVTWDVQESLEPGGTLRPALVIAPQLRQLPVDLIYVACPEIDTVYVVRADRNWVVDAIGVKGGPTHLALKSAPVPRYLYVLAAREATVKSVDLLSHRVADFFPVPLGDTPTFMTLSPDGRWGYLLDERSGHLSRMDLSSGRSAARVRLGFRPQHATFLERQNLLAVSLPLAQKVVLLDPLSLQQVRAIATGSEPAGLLVFDQLLYIAESGDHSVAIVDLPGQREVGRVTVGLAPSRLVESDRIIYVSNTEDGSLSVLIPGQLGVVRDVRGLDRPREMAFNRFYRRLYVADEMARALVVVDVNSNLIVGRIALGARPTGMAVTP